MTEFLSKLAPYAKAVAGALVASAVAFFGSLSTALSADSVSFSTLTDGQWVAAIVAALTALPVVGGTVYSITNKP